MFFRRNGRLGTSDYGAKHQGAAYLTIVALCIGLTGVLLLTTRENNLHNIGRGAMSTIFSGLFLYVFVAISKALNEIDEATSKTSKTTIRQMKALFQHAFLEFLLAIACWVTDNSCCIFLQTQLPVYPQLHAFWHLFTCTGLYKLILILAYIEQEGKGVGKAELRYRLRFLPILLVVPKKS